MKKTRVKGKTIMNIVKTVLFFTLLLFVLSRVYRVLSWKDTAGNYLSTMENFYNLEDDVVDVLFVGSSHCYCSVNNSKLWKDKGIAAYSLAISGQDLASSYYCINEALKTQKPKVVFVEMYGATYHGYGVEGNLYRNVLPHKLSFDYYDVVNGVATEENKKDVMLKWPIIHTRYKELKKEDFAEELPVYIGYQPEFTTKDIGWKDGGLNYYQGEKSLPLDEEEANWIEKIIELTKKNGVEVCFFLSPYAASEEEQMKYKTVEDMAKKANVPFINFIALADKINLEANGDFIDWGHTNFSGATKITNYLETYILEHYAVTNHTDQEKYETWDFDLKIRNHEQQNYKMSQRADVFYFLNALSDFEDYTIFLTTNGDYYCESAGIEDWLEELGILEDFFEGEGVWIFENGEISWAFDRTAQKSYIDKNGLDILVSNNDGKTQLRINKFDFMKACDGLNIVVYDNLKGAIVDAIGFPTEQEYAGVR